jgi:hypothetical protein
MMGVALMESLPMPGSEVAMQIFIQQLESLGNDIRGMRGELKTLNEFIAEAKGENLKGRIAKLEDERVKALESRVAQLETTHVVVKSTAGGAWRMLRTIGIALAALGGYAYWMWELGMRLMQYYRAGR